MKCPVGIRFLPLFQPVLLLVVHTVVETLSKGVMLAGLPGVECSWAVFWSGCCNPVSILQQSSFHYILCFNIKTPQLCFTYEIIIYTGIYTGIARQIWAPCTAVRFNRWKAYTYLLFFLYCAVMHLIYRFQRAK